MNHRAIFISPLFMFVEKKKSLGIDYQYTLGNAAVAISGVPNCSAWTTCNSTAQVAFLSQMLLE